MISLRESLCLNRFAGDTILGSGCLLVATAGRFATDVACEGTRGTTGTTGTSSYHRCNLTMRASAPGRPGLRDPQH